MKLEYIFINLGLAFLLLKINGFLGGIQYKYNETGIFDYGRFSFSPYKEFNFSGNYVQKIINPTVFTAVATALFQYFGLMRICYSLWMIIIFYWILVFSRVLILQKIDFVNWQYELIALSVSVILCEGSYLFLIKPLLDDGKSVFISPEQLRDAIWYAILSYIALTMWKVCKLYFNSSAITSDQKIQDIILKRYEKFSEKYGNQIISEINRYEWCREEKLSFLCLVYSIMIFEDFNRPWVYRKIERMIKRICPDKAMTLGVMQVMTRTVISDEESVSRGIEKLHSAYLGGGGEHPIDDAIRDYNDGDMYYDEVHAIYDKLNFLCPFDGLFAETDFAECS